MFTFASIDLTIDTTNYKSVVTLPMSKLIVGLQLKWEENKNKTTKI